MQSELTENTKINTYTLQCFIGNGTFGEVWLAHEDEGGREVAMKFYVSLDERGRQDFQKEYNLASEFRHPNLLSMQEYGEYGHRPYLVMPYCGNGSADKYVGELQPGEEGERVVWRFIRDVASGLAYLHERDIVHQDIKPANILVDSDDNFVITDFGISTNLKSTMRRQSKRSTNAGATAYMAPERFDSVPRTIKASDLWSLGASIYELVTGQLPFVGMGGVMLKNGADMPDIAALGWSADLNTAMQKCLAKEPWDRIKAADLADLAAEKLAPKPQNPAPAPKETLPKNNLLLPSKNNSKTPLILALLLLLIGGVIGGIVLHNNQKEREAMQQAIQRERDSIAKAEAAKAAEEKRHQDSIAKVEADKAAEKARIAEQKRVKDSIAKAKAEEAKKNSTAQQISGTASEHHYVDLGLPSGTLWATTNVGALSPEDAGDYFAWGETTTKSKYDWSTYKYANGAYNKLTKYCNKSDHGNNGYTDSRTTLEKSDDVACQKWGSDWCMPTQAQFQELKDKCSWTWTTRNGKKGYEVKSKKNGNSIFLPAAGLKDSNGKTSGLGSGYYWSSSLRADNPIFAHRFCFDSGGVYPVSGWRFGGLSVRPVRN